ncbi:hypothetical protein FOA52_008703 [Chlamydomonas sp. UWO 241]|nr:hypothetical protein FOA52_008703 [Chlamydomonas sp. UWO 241]
MSNRNRAPRGVPPSFPARDAPMAHSKFWCASWPAQDTLGEVMAHVSMLPYFVILHSASRLYSRRDVHEIFVLAGLVLNELLARVMKEAAAQARPTVGGCTTCTPGAYAATNRIQERCMLLGTCNSHGMPSSHAQCMAFALALHLMLLLKHRAQRSKPAAFVAAAEVLAMALGTAAVAYSRVYLMLWKSR